MLNGVGVNIRESVNHIFVVPFTEEKCASIMVSLQFYFPSHALWLVGFRCTYIRSESDVYLLVLSVQPYHINETK